MSKKDLILLKAMLKASSLRNIYKHTTDAKRKNRIIGNYVGLAVIYTMIIAYSIASCVGFGEMGITEYIPAMGGLIISALAFVFTLLKTNGYLFNFKEYDSLMSLPFEPRTIARDKFLYMYIKSLPWYLSISAAMMIGYGIYAGPAIWIYLLWIVLSLLLPVIPMLVAALIGFIIAKIGSGFRKTNAVQTILTFIFVLFCFSLRYIVEAIFKNDAVENTLESIGAMTDKASSVYIPLGWFAKAINEASIVDALLFVFVSVILFELVFWFVGKSYRQINSALKSHAASKSYKMTGQKRRSVVSAIAFKEFKRMTGSTVYMTNAALGELMAVIFSVAVLIIGFDKVIAIVTQDAPFDPSIVYPAIPLIVYFLIGMVSTTVMSPSLEGKNYWIVQSLPITKKVLYQGKMLFNMCLTVPFMTLAIICASLTTQLSPLSILLYVIEGLVLCAFSTCWGCVIGIKHMRLDWENEVEVVKQGAAVAIYLLPNMFVTMGLVVGVVVLGFVVDSNLISLILTLVIALLAGLSYLKVMKLAKK